MNMIWGKWHHLYKMTLQWLAEQWSTKQGLTQQWGKVIRWTGMVFLASVLSGCSAELDEYQSQSPAFDLFGYFEGETRAWGMVQDYTNKQTRRFYVSLTGTVKGDTLVLDEQFVYDDGEKDTRVWTIERLPDGRYRGKADYIIGVALGQEKGNALRWQYDFLLKYGEGSEMTVSFDDWLYRQDAHHVFNLTSIRKLGIEVATVTLFFRKETF
ncbi:hypothetical protein VA7868_00429 [Vibrio aerogenes CECT 7868]|uniref:Lipoprotein n=2 Tax=Vibrio aerogenes TaxID=92172 RepID=A0A1M5VL58_9VIBR|nr:hypothetical protein VA7868_00429 [Vibrio aerogenes CECT 7868]